MIRQLIVVGLVAAIAVPGELAYAAGDRPSPPRPTWAGQPIDPELMARYIRDLPIGAAVRLRTVDGTRRRVVLMAVEDDAMVVQRRGRRPEPPYRVPIRDVQSLEIDRGGSPTGLSVAVGVASGVGSFLLMLLLLSLTIDD